MKIIDLLNKIANGEEVPKKIKVYNDIYKYESFNSLYWNSKNKHLLEVYNGIILNYEVEVIEDTPKEYINVSEEQVLFNNLSYEEQQFILKQMRMLQPCELENNGE